MANPTVFTYDPKQYSTIVGGNIITGFSDDDFVEIERDEDAFTKKVGVDGEITRAKSNNRAGHIILRIMQSSSSNDALSALAAADEATNAGAVPALAKDVSGRSAFATDVCWVKKYPKTVWKKGVAFWEWTLDCGNLEIFIGGN
jgi:hypothetical protein